MVVTSKEPSTHMEWRHRFRSLSKTFYVGRAKTAVVDERSVNIKGMEAWRAITTGSDIISLGKPPPRGGGLEPHTMLSIVGG